MKHQVIVGNIGTVYDGNNCVEAAIAYGQYKKLSEQEYGRAAGENVVWLKDGEIRHEHVGKLDAEELRGENTTEEEL